VEKIGFIAQDLQEVQKETNTLIPNLVDDHNPEKLGVCTANLIPVMVKAIQDLNNEIKELKKENQGLERRFTLLEDTNNNNK
jgi:hypothetical protein